MAAGLEPVTTNPIEMQIIKLREMQRYFHGTKMAQELKDTGIARWIPEEQEHRAAQTGWIKLNDKIFQPVTRETGHGTTSHGAWYAPKPAATIFNNYMSEGLHGKYALYDAWRAAGNALNQAQLGLSGFHATFIAFDMLTSRIALGMQQATRGDFGKGAANMALGFNPWTWVSTVQKGSALRNAYLNPANASPEMRKAVAALVAGGGRISMDQFYRSNASGSFFKNLTDLKNPDGAWREVVQMFRDTPMTFPLRMVGRILETITEPLMGQLVPRAKLGVFYMLAEDWLRRNPTASPDAVSAAMTKIQDSVDNRMGQMVYDNLFWNHTMKDVAFVTTRAVGWNLGTVREIGGAGVDTARQAWKAARLQKPEMTERMAYTIALGIFGAVLGTVVTYLMTEKGPESLTDLFYPPDGRGGRIQFPGYVKDIVAYGKAPVQTLFNKAHPLISMAQQIAKNRDYHGGTIYNSDTDNIGRAYGEYLLNEVVPFSVKSRQKLEGQGAGRVEQALAFWGIQPAPASITDPARGQAWQARQDKAGLRARAKEDATQGRLHLP